ncbi:anti-sigma factor family protein [Sphingomonas edaphi]|uniref:Anti-sigma factor n=1 Tax=Sphingomonas edaphi TaxID=2315689 RepID=A0A418Q310_9SPHN|nr:anti-sigma factor [Sphingomonas edaphi]RIX32365.1 anti-sigma factor [Sphingomonas edaphi]
MIDDEKFFAWLDGELPVADAARIAEQVGADPALIARAAEHRALAASLRAGFAPLMEGKMPPPRFAPAEVVDLSARRKQWGARGSFGLPQWAAMAATLAVGIVAGHFVGGRDSSPIQSLDGQLVAAASLDEALNSQLASSEQGGAVRIGLTFRDKAGGICRTFSENGATGLACRDGDHWRVDGLFGAAEGQQSDYRMAAGADPRIASMIDERINGDPFGPAAERAARGDSWR